MATQTFDQWKKSVPYSDDEITMTRAAFDEMPAGRKSFLPDGSVWVLQHTERRGSEFQPVEIIEPCEFCDHPMPGRHARPCPAGSTLDAA